MDLGNWASTGGPGMVRGLGCFGSKCFVLSRVLRLTGYGAWEAGSGGGGEIYDSKADRGVLVGMLRER
jgi:hypothetical protein